MLETEIKIVAGDTEPLEVVISAQGLANLDDLSSGEAYFWLEDSNTNHIDGASVTVSSSSDRKVQLDPVGAKAGGGNAFDAAGTYIGYIKITWADTDTSRHPGSESEFLRVIVTANRES